MGCRILLTILKTLIKIERLGWLGQLCRMQEPAPCKQLTVLKAEGTGRVGKHKLKLLESVEKNLRKMGVRNWRRE